MYIGLSSVLMGMPSLMQICSVFYSTSDTQALLRFKASADIQNSLVSRNTSNCCSLTAWVGVICERGRVSLLALRSLELTGSIDVLVELSELRTLVINNNRLDGFFSNLTHWKLLWLLNLSSKRFSGPIPPLMAFLSRLWRLDLSNNVFNGSVPPWINFLRRLLTLRLHNNALTGAIPSLNFPSLMDSSLQHNNLSGSIPPLLLSNLTLFDASFNNLSGPIPPPLNKFLPSAFSSNADLCGGPLPACNQTNSILSNLASPMLVLSNPSANPSSTPFTKRSSRLTFGMIVAIVIGDVIILLLLIQVVVVYYWKRVYSNAEDCKKSSPEEDLCYLPSLQTQDASERNKVVFFSEARRFKPEDLLRASAEKL